MRFSTRTLVPTLALALCSGALLAVRQFVFVVVPASTPNATIGVYGALVGVVGFLVNPVGAVVVGYLVGEAVDVPAQYRRVTVTAAIAGVLGVVPGYLLVVQSLPQRPVLVGSVLLPLAEVALSGTVTLALAVLAGAAVAHFRRA